MNWQFWKKDDKGTDPVQNSNNAAIFAVNQQTLMGLKAVADRLTGMTQDTDDEKERYKQRLLKEASGL